MLSCASNQGTGHDYHKNHIGVPNAHAFTINDTVKLSDGTKLIRIRNPWGSEWFHGDWSDYSGKWNDQYKKEAGYVKGDDGLWFISADDYHSSFATTTINQDIDGWHQSYFAVLDQDTDYDKYTYLTITSKVYQQILMSAYIYDNQFSKHYDSDCTKHWTSHGTGNNLNVSCDACFEAGEKDFTFDPYHYNAIYIAEGEQI